MKTLTETIQSNIGYESITFDAMLDLGRWEAGKRKPTWPQALATYADIRAAYGFARKAAPLLTAPEDNLKLEKGVVPSYGLTLQHYVQKLTTGLTVNACPWAGDCTKVCVLDNGRGRYSKVQLARRAKTEFLALHPLMFAYLLGRELALAVKRDGMILFRPNVNSDVEWQTIAPMLTNGLIFGDAVKMYGYSKDEAVLATDGWLGTHYRVAYSWNENSSVVADLVEDFLRRGGSVAMVTDRKPKSEVRRFYSIAPSADADLTDEWIFQSGVIGDLSAKGKARRLIGKSGFVVTPYGTSVGVS